MHRYLDDLRKDTDAYVAPWHLHSSIIDIERGTRPRLNEYRSIRFAPSIANVSSTRFITGISQNMPSGMRMVFATPRDGLLEIHETGKRRKLTATRHDEIFSGGRA
jgi:hypothetical protein